MQAPPGHRDKYRGVQRCPRPGTAAYMTAKRQTALSLQRFHILCARVQNRYTLRDIEPVPTLAERRKEEPSCISGGELVTRLTINLDAGSDRVHPDDLDRLSKPRIRATIDFGAYKEFNLRPITGVDLPRPGTDGSIDFMECSIYHDTVRDDWKTREGGILYAVAEYGDFFSYVSHYHSPYGRIGTGVWNALFEKLRNSGYSRNVIPCMVSRPNDVCNISTVHHE
jgi:hypothetical protein